MAQNWHKNFALVSACSGFTWRVWLWRISGS